MSSMNFLNVRSLMFNIFIKISHLIPSHFLHRYLCVSSDPSCIDSVLSQDFKVLITLLKHRSNKVQSSGDLNYF